MMRSSIHIITTMRRKIEYAMEQDYNSKTTIRKVGLAAVQRSGIEYEFTWVVDMNLDHTAFGSKSRAAKLDDLVQNKPDVDWFGQFYDWLAKGEEPPQTKQDLIEFGDSIGLEPGDIATALKEADLDWDPANWAEITNVVTIYAECDNTHEEEEIPEV
jgi:hypothetical protein